MMMVSLLFWGCLLAAVPAMFEPEWGWFVLSVLGYGLFGMVFWNDNERRREWTWVSWALLVFSTVMGMVFWHRVFRVMFWVALVRTETDLMFRQRVWWMEALAFFVWGLSLVFSFSSWQWWVGVIDVVGWLVLAGMFVWSELALRERELS